ncbi:hypothetical protein Y032_0009g800 [Ancylostoma ceylanicum]|uniref:Uncharacterized protein n=1 Tax=Ancylostoma ceylanicum TaxID=53326 RepID=A0A016VJ17_9BILA|nr:hypothetical protein Y032_0009g800 [Ancylostoma ceylanicum]
MPRFREEGTWKSSKDNVKILIKCLRNVRDIHTPSCDSTVGWLVVDVRPRNNKWNRKEARKEVSLRRYPNPLTSLSNSMFCVLPHKAHFISRQIIAIERFRELEACQNITSIWKPAKWQDW